jgi:hypothetical protein
MLPHHLRLHCLHAPPPLGTPLANPHHPLQPRAQPPQPTARNIVSALPAFASTRSQRSCPRYTRRTTEAQRRQLRHPCETRCQRRCPISSNRIDCMHRRPSARPSPSPATTCYSPAPNRPSPQHATSSAHLPAFASIRSQRSCPRYTRRTIKVQRCQLRQPSETRCQRRCPIISDRIDCTHRRPSARPSPSPATRYSPAHDRRSPKHATSSTHLPAFASTHSQRSCPSIHAAYRRGPATSAASSFRDSVPATLPHHLRSH